MKPHEKKVTNISQQLPIWYPGKSSISAKVKNRPFWNYSPIFSQNKKGRKRISTWCVVICHQHFIKGIGELLPDAAIIFDKFHVMKMVNQAVDEVRREEQKGNRFLKKTRFLWLKNPKNLTERQQKGWDHWRRWILKLSELTISSYLFKCFGRFQIPISLKSTSRNGFSGRLIVDFNHSSPSRIRSLDGILNYFTNKVTNGLLEGLNSLIQSLKANARGYCNDDNFMIMIYLRHGLLDLHLPIWNVRETYFL